MRRLAVSLTVLALMKCQCRGRRIESCGCMYLVHKCDVKVHGLREAEDRSALGKSMNDS